MTPWLTSPPDLLCRQGKFQPRRAAGTRTSWFRLRHVSAGELRAARVVRRSGTYGIFRCSASAQFTGTGGRYSLLQRRVRGGTALNDIAGQAGRRRYRCASTRMWTPAPTRISPPVCATTEFASTWRPRCRPTGMRACRTSGSVASICHIGSRLTDTTRLSMPWTGYAAGRPAAHGRHRTRDISTWAGGWVSSIPARDCHPPAPDVYARALLDRMAGGAPRRSCWNRDVIPAVASCDACRIPETHRPQELCHRRRGNEHDPWHDVSYR